MVFKMADEVFPPTAGRGRGRRPDNFPFLPHSPPPPRRNNGWDAVSVSSSMIAHYGSYPSSESSTSGYCGSSRSSSVSIENANQIAADEDEQLQVPVVHCSDFAKYVCQMNEKMKDIDHYKKMLYNSIAMIKSAKTFGNGEANDSSKEQQNDEGSNVAAKEDKPEEEEPKRGIGRGRGRGRRRGN